MVESGSLTDAQRAALEGDEEHPFGTEGIELVWRAKERHVMLLDEEARPLASTGLLVVEVSAGGGEPFEVVGVGGVIVTRSHRGRGLARVVVEAALERAARMGPAFAILFCRDAIAGLYRKLGFEPVEPPVLGSSCGDGWRLRHAARSGFLDAHDVAAQRQQRHRDELQVREASGSSGRRQQVADLHTVLRGQALRDQGAVAGLGVAFDAQQRGGPVGRQLGGQCGQVGPVEDLRDVAVAIGGRELRARALAHALPVVLRVLEPAQLRGGRQLEMMLVAHPRPLERCLEPLRVRPGVLASAHAAALAHVQQEADAGRGERLQELVEGPPVDPDRGQPSDVTTSLPAALLSPPPAGEKTRS